MSIYHSTTVAVTDPADVQARHAPTGIERIHIQLGRSVDVGAYLSPAAARALVEQVTAVLTEHDEAAAVTA